MTIEQIKKGLSGIIVTPDYRLGHSSGTFYYIKNKNSNKNYIFLNYTNYSSPHSFSSIQIGVRFNRIQNILLSLVNKYLNINQRSSQFRTTIQFGIVLEEEIKSKEIIKPEELSAFLLAVEEAIERSVLVWFENNDTLEKVGEQLKCMPLKEQNKYLAGINYLFIRLIIMYELKEFEFYKKFKEEAIKVYTEANSNNRFQRHLELLSNLDKELELMHS